jgi:very-short-patch-repair endonuclease
MSELESRFAYLWEEMFPDIDLYIEEKLIPKRRYRFDFVHKEAKVAIEINGQTWQKGGHSSGTGLIRDYTKLNLAQALGYVVFQLSSEMITDKWLTLIANTIESRLYNAKKQA